MDPSPEEATFNKSSALFLHLFGLELPGSLLIVHGNTLHVVTSSKKCDILEALQQGRPGSGTTLILHRRVRFLAK